MLYWFSFRHESTSLSEILCTCILHYIHGTDTLNCILCVYTQITLQYNVMSNGWVLVVYVNTHLKPVKLYITTKMRREKIRTFQLLSLMWVSKFNLFRFLCKWGTLGLCCVCMVCGYIGIFMYYLVCPYFVSLTYTAFAVTFIIPENKYLNFLYSYGIFETIYLKDLILQV